MASKLQRAMQIRSSIKDNRLDNRSPKFLSRWVLLFIDTFLLICSVVLAVLVLSDLRIDYLQLLNTKQQVFLVIGLNLLFMLIFKAYADSKSHITYLDIFKLVLASTTTFAVLIVANYTSLAIEGEKIFFNAFLVLYMFFSFTFLFLFRLAMKQVYEFFKVVHKSEKLEKAVIVGLDESAISLGATLEIEHPRRFEIQGFAAYKNFNSRVQILGKPIFKIENKITDQLKKLDATAVIIVGNELSVERKYSLLEDCLENDIKIYNAPNVLDWSKNKSIANQVKNLQIEDLLGREPIVLQNNRKDKHLANKTILVTGGAGSIGNEIVRQLAAFNPKLILVLDQAETPLHDLQLELTSTYTDLNFKCLICDVANRDRLSKVFKNYDIDVVYHAAAYKHVPLMEDNASEAVITNIYGTKNLADLAVMNNVERFVLVSTDKAVNPSSVMGATKRAAELYVQFRNFYKNGTGSISKTKFITTRFGNVLGSNGSVVPLFKKQIEMGGPITITHPDIIRYFMTISEACQLVLEAGEMGEGGEIYIFDMGEPVKIMDLATKMIKLAGYELNADIDIKITGLRSGEKLYEELISSASRAMPTHHNKILIAKDEIMDFDFVRTQVNKIVDSAFRHDDNRVVTQLKALVPEFISKNSHFESLDLNCDALDIIKNLKITPPETVQNK